MLSIGPLFILSISLFTFFAWLFAFETRRGKRVFLPSLRSNLDVVLDTITMYIGRQLTYIGRHTIKLSWYYSIHKVLRFILSSLVKSYDYLEMIFMRNRDRARTLKLEKRTFKQGEGHLNQVAEHKASTALTETQKKKLLQKKLERG
jgi:hypothetical protein